MDVVCGTHYDSSRLLRLLAVDIQVDELAEMISTVFMVHHGTNLQTFKSLNDSLVIQAAELSVQTFFTQVENYIKGTVGLVTNLPAELGGLPKNVRLHPSLH